MVSLETIGGSPAANDTAYCLAYSNNDDNILFTICFIYTIVFIISFKIFNTQLVVCAEMVSKLTFGSTPNKPINYYLFDIYSFKLYDDNYSTIKV